MRKYDFQNKWQKLLVPDIVALLTQIHEFKGEQNLFIEANSDTLTQLVEVAKIQSRQLGNRVYAKCSSQPIQLCATGRPCRSRETFRSICHDLCEIIFSRLYLL